MECSFSENNVYCKKQKLFTKAEDLCKHCQIPAIIQRYISRIYEQAEYNRLILSDVQYETWINCQTLDAAQAMGDMRNYALQNLNDGQYAGNWNLIYHWNGARIKALNGVQQKVLDPINHRTTENNVRYVGQSIVYNKPIFDKYSSSKLFSMIGRFFSEDDKPLLNQLLLTGKDIERKIIFMGNGNRLSDTFKKLIENDIITGCQKKKLQNWIVRNFQYIYRNETRNYTFDTVEKIISRNSTPCKNPIIEVEKGEILWADKSNIKNH